MGFVQKEHENFSRCGFSRRKVVTDLIEQERLLGQQKTPPTNKHLFVTFQMVEILLLANISIPYRYSTAENLSDLDFDLLMSVNVKFDNAIGLAI